MKKGVRYGVLIFLASILIAFLPGIIGSFFTISETQSDWWYASRPSITPPGYVFPIVWNILYFLIGLSLFFVWVSDKKPVRKIKKKIFWLFAINLSANALWSILFFKFRMPFVAFVDIILIWATILYLIIILWKTERTSAYLLLPYFLWVTFASFLNFLFI